MPAGTASPEHPPPAAVHLEKRSPANPAIHDPAYAALRELREIVASEGYAMTALTLGRYRSDLLVTIDNYITDCTP